ncbi:MAG: flagellar basal body P-ring protein FlgI [Brevinematales bacterium]|nr:flagellar basal body P-ring protein FlgI [Brevinematales bacterium]
MNKIILIFIISINTIFSATVELKNIVTIEGYNDNPLLGYGIVVGLKGTGDSDNGSHAKQILGLIAKNFGFKVDTKKLRARNSAIVIVTANLNPFSQSGSKVDVKVSSVYDAKSLEGGELIVTPLLGGDNEIYAIASGKVQTDKNTKGISGIIPQGAIIQKSVSKDFLNDKKELTLIINDNVGISSVIKIVSEIQKKFPENFKSFSGNSMVIKFNDDEDVLDTISKIFATKIELQEEPSVIIDALSGIVVAGGNVVISEAAISYKNIQLNIGNQPSSIFSVGKEEKNLQYIRNSTTVSELVDSLNQLGISGRDIAKIIELLYKNGNLKAKLIIQ